ncbi:MAG TPA: hypothetical protein VGG83_03025 [Trebonia sp.]
MRNSRAASHRSRHCSWVSRAASRFSRARISFRPPRVTDREPAANSRSARARRAFSAFSRIALPCRSAGVAYPLTCPAFVPAGTASRVSIFRTRALRQDPGVFRGDAQPRPHARARTLEDLAATAHVSRATLSRRFTRLVREPPSAGVPGRSQAFAPSAS